MNRVNKTKAFISEFHNNPQFIQKTYNESKANLTPEENKVY